VQGGSGSADDLAVDRVDPVGAASGRRLTGGAACSGPELSVARGEPSAYYTILCNNGTVSEPRVVCAPVTGPAPAGKPPLAVRPLITPKQAAQLVVLFKVLGNDTRLRLLHALHREGAVSVGKLADQVGMRPQAVSNQLQRLTDRGIVAARREGTRIFYSIADPCVPSVLDLALCLTEETAVARHGWS